MVNCFDCIYDPMCGLASKMSKHTNISCNDFKAKNAPTIEAEPGIHARWVESKEGYFSCSNCHNDAMVELYENSQKLTLFCPYCGATMDERVNNNA